MSKFINKLKEKLIEKLNAINKTSEKDILNLKVSELRQINENEKIENLTIKDIEIIWELQDSIREKSLLGCLMKK